MSGEQRYDINDFIEFVAGDRTKKDVFKGEHFNIVVICLENGYEIPPHEEPYDVLFNLSTDKKQTIVNLLLDLLSYSL